MSYARPKILGDKDIQAWIRRKQDGGKDNPNTARHIARQLEKGNALSSKAANKYGSGKYDTDRQRFMRSAGAYGGTGGFAEAVGKDAPANVAGLDGIKVGKGNVYVGATEVETPDRSYSDRNGWHSRPGSKSFVPAVLPRGVFAQAAGSRDAADDSTDSVTEPGATEPGPDLIAAREAYDRANAYSAQSPGGSFASLPDLSKTGGDLFNEIQAGGQRQLDDYERRFIPRLLANANLTAQEIGYSAQDAIANLPADLNLPDYTSMFGGKNERKIDKRGLYDLLSKEIA